VSGRIFADLGDGRLTGITECIGSSSATGPGFIFLDGQWYDVRNSEYDGAGTPSLVARNFRTVYPVGVPDFDLAGDAERITAEDSGVPGFEHFCPVTLSGSSATFVLEPTGTDRPLVPATILVSTGGFHDIVGELDGVTWVSGSGVASQDTVLSVSGERYRIVQNGSRVRTWSFMALRES
jgi:hypothetical protein